MCHKVEREIEGRNRRHDAAWHAQCEPHLAHAAGCGVKRYRFTVQIARRISGQIDGLHGAPGFDTTLGQYFAFLTADQACDLLLLFRHQLCGAAQNLHPPMGWQRTHDGRALLKAVHGGRNVGRRPGGHGVQHSAVVGMGHFRDRPAFLPLALQIHFHAASECGRFMTVCHTNDF